MSFRLQRTRIGVIRGGPSDEYYVSLKTGAEILKILRENFPEKYEPFDILIDMKGVWHMNGLPRKPEDIVTKMDLIINALHGHYGEDGKVQRMLEGLSVPFTGSGSFASAMSINKHTTKSFLKDKDIKMPHHELIRKENFNQASISETFRSVPMPAVVKPADNGSSFGISIVRTPDELAKGFEKAFGYSDLVIVEEYLPGREATCGVIDGFRGEEVYTLPPIEIIHNSNFFDYDAKYSGQTKEIVPSNFSQSVKDKIREYSKKVHQILNLKHYSRSDFIVHPKRGVYFLEVNTLPGLTSESLFPKSLNAVGATTAQFLDHIILISLK